MIMAANSSTTTSYDSFKTEKQTPFNSQDLDLITKTTTPMSNKKNWTHARQLPGYDRLENPDQLPLINQLYQTWELFQNHFCANLKLREKKRVGSKYIKRYSLTNIK